MLQHSNSLKFVVTRSRIFLTHRGLTTQYSKHVSKFKMVVHDNNCGKTLSSLGDFKSFINKTKL